MARHKRSHKTKEYSCDYCPYKGTTNFHLRRHMRIHIGSKPYKCLHCNYTCNAHENLRKHVIVNRVHAGKFLYPCKHCPYGTHSSREMREHLKTKHNVELDNDKQVGIYIGTFVKADDHSELPEGACAIPLKERLPQASKLLNFPICEPPKNGGNPSFGVPVNTGENNRLPQSHHALPIKEVTKTLMVPKVESLEDSELVIDGGEGTEESSILEEGMSLIVTCEDGENGETLLTVRQCVKGSTERDLFTSLDTTKQDPGAELNSG